MVILFHLNKIPDLSHLWNALLMVQAFKNLKSSRPKQDWTFFPCMQSFILAKRRNIDMILVLRRLKRFNMWVF